MFWGAQPGSGTSDRWLPGWPGRLHVLVDLDTRLALDTRLLHRVAQFGAAEERFGVGRGGEAVGAGLLDQLRVGPGGHHLGQASQEA
jgi:hypothetical protein